MTSGMNFGAASAFPMSGSGHQQTSGLVRAKSVDPSGADMRQLQWHVSLVPILLQKSFWGVERKFLEPLVRFARGDVSDHIG
jgi:hypothetical protein